MFDHKRVMAHSALCVSAVVQIQHEAHHNYAKVIDRHPTTDGAAPEELPYHGEIKNTLRVQYSATLPFAPIRRQEQPKPATPKTSPLHNYHLSIISSFSPAAHVGASAESHIVTFQLAQFG
jgi:hypothetical protein